MWLAGGRPSSPTEACVLACWAWASRSGLWSSGAHTPWTDTVQGAEGQGLPADFQAEGWALQPSPTLFSGWVGLDDGKG